MTAESATGAMPVFVVHFDVNNDHCCINVFLIILIAKIDTPKVKLRIFLTKSHAEGFTSAGGLSAFIFEHRPVATRARDQCGRAYKCGHTCCVFDTNKSVSHKTNRCESSGRDVNWYDRFRLFGSGGPPLKDQPLATGDKYHDRNQDQCATQFVISNLHSL